MFVEANELKGEDSEKKIENRQFSVKEKKEVKSG
jgi:hypothetical protein